MPVRLGVRCLSLSLCAWFSFAWTIPRRLTSDSGHSIWPKWHGSNPSSTAQRPLLRGMPSYPLTLLLCYDRSRDSAAIWMELSALMLCIVTFGLRVTWLKFKPRPEWTMKNHGDFHDQHQPPISAALPPPDEMPPTWSVPFHHFTSSRPTLNSMGDV